MKIINDKGHEVTRRNSEIFTSWTFVLFVVFRFCEC
jgi:hypothetical protein